MSKVFLPLGLLALLIFVCLVWRPGFDPPYLGGTPDPNAHRDAFTNPYWPTIESPKLTTPQWIGEDGVEAAAVLSIDDMRGIEPYQSFIEPILQRLEAIDGRAPLTIFTNTIDPNEPQLQRWLARGLSIEVHTIDHPCPLLKDSDFAKARDTVHQCIDLLEGIPNMRPTTYRMPCCDSMNTPSPRFYENIMGGVTPGGNFLSADSSVFQIFTKDDPELPRSLFAGENETRFKRYAPLGKDFVNIIYNYPYPYLIGKQHWQFPCTVPSDWEAQYLQKENNPRTVEDLEAALDATVAKQGLFVLVFHPHGWIENTQVAELVDHAQKTHGNKLKFLNMRDVQERIDQHMLASRPIRNSDGNDSGTRLLDLNEDGYMDVHFKDHHARVWDPKARKWHEHQDVDITVTKRPDINEPDDGILRFWDLDSDGDLDAVYSNATRFAVYILDGERWTRPRVGTHPAENAPPPFVREDGSNNGVWMDEKSFIIQNEDTAEEPNVIRRIPFSKVLTDPPPVTLTPRDALQGMSTKPDLEVQVAVQEPLVMDPIDLAWGPDGKLWVVEMTDYPLGIDDNGKVGGRVRFLEDKDQDGRYETSSLFLEGLRYPTSVMAWRKGALVLAAPDLLYAEDTTGDGKADKREVLYTGFTEGNQQHRANGLRWGLDNWIYVANGDSGGEIKSNKTRTTVSLGHHDLRIRPDEGLLELVAGQTQFGRNRNDAGDWFGCNNSNPLWHYVLDDVALKRNPHFSPPSGIRHMPEVPGNAPVFPISVTEERFNDFHTANCITSACGTMIYRASLLGPAYQGNAFICEPVHNLVHRQVISTDGVTFASTRADDELTSEFLSSTDPSFRPVSMHTAPDGSLWVVDMQREVIEHPEWIPHDREEQLDLRAGHERGTLYRLAPKGHQAVATPDLTKLEDDALVVMLDNDSGTMRDLAQQALLWRDAPKVEDVISSPNWKMRLHALATLDGVERVSVPTVSKALEDSHPAVRRLAMRLAGQLGGDWDFPQENDPTVLLQKAITLGALKDHGEDIASLALSSSDTYIRATCVSSMLSDIDGFMAVLTHALLTEDHAPFLRWVMNSLKGANETGALNAMAIKLSQSAEPESWQLDMISLALPNEELMISIAPLIETSRQWVDNPDADTNLRVAALEMLGKGQVLKASEELTKFCQPGEPAALQIASLRLLAELFPDEMPNWLLSSWPNLEPDLRLEVSLALASRPAIAKVVVNRLADDPIPDLARSLSQHQNTDVSAAADKLIDQPLATDQQSLITEVLSKKGLPASGKAHFQQVCSVCHVLEGQGNDVGPDLASLADPSKEFLLNAILNPNQAVEDKYLAYIAETTNGQATVGLLESETGGALHLRLANGDAQDVLRRDLVKLTSTGRSLMPEGLTGSLASQDVADLIAYVQSAKTPRKTFEFNEPKQVDQEEDGTINLAATAASVHGPSLTFERRYLNLGNWCHVQDQAVWAFTCTKPGRYAIALDFSCADGSAGNKLSLTLGDQRQTATIEGTGNWNGYRQTQIGTFELTEGTHELSARSEGSIRDHLIDLRNIILRPNPEN